LFSHNRGEVVRVIARESFLDTIDQFPQPRSRGGRTYQTVKAKDTDFGELSTGVLSLKAEFPPLA